MSTLKRQKADGSWEYLQTTGQDVAELSNKIGVLSNLKTTVKDKIVGAINELFDKHAAHEAETATETQKGHVELATAAETAEGIDNTKAVHPVGLRGELNKKIDIYGYALPDSSGPQSDLATIPNLSFYVATVNNRFGYPATYGTIFGYKDDTNNAGRYSWQIFHGSDASTMYRRYGTSTTTWSTWKAITEA